MERSAVFRSPGFGLAGWSPAVWIWISHPKRPTTPQGSKPPTRRVPNLSRDGPLSGTNGMCDMIGPLTIGQSNGSQSMSWGYRIAGVRPLREAEDTLVPRQDLHPRGTLSHNCPTGVYSSEVSATSKKPQLCSSNRHRSPSKLQKGQSHWTVKHDAAPTLLPSGNFLRVLRCTASGRV